MTKKIALLFSMFTTLILPSFSIACTKNDFNKNKHEFIQKNNYPNDYKEFSYLENNLVSNNINEINLAVSTKLFRLKAQKQPKIDFRDNIVLFPSELSRKFELASKLVVNNKESKETSFFSDDIDLVDYTDSNEQKIGIFKPKKDKGNGFKSPFLFIPSSNKNSINSEEFNQKLSNANLLKITTNTKKNTWVDYSGKLVANNNILDAKDFKLGILSKLLKNKAFRNKYINENNININKFEDLNNSIDGFDLYSYLEENDIDINMLIDFSTNNEIILQTKSKNNTNLYKIFENIFILQNYSDAIPYEILKNKYKIEDFKRNLDWFFAYGKTFRDLYYASPYYINQLNSSKTVLTKNPFYISNENDILNKITILYNPLPLSNNTFSLQATNAFKQNIISKLEYENLNLSEKEYILNNFRKYNFSYQKNYNHLNLNSKIVINQNPNINTSYMNKNFMKLFYGYNEKTNEFNLTKEVLSFQSMFNNLINQYALVHNNSDIWLSQAPQNLTFDAKNNAINIDELKDAFLQISKPIIFDKDNKKIQNTFLYQNKNRIINPNIISINEKIKSSWFEEIKNNLISIINKFFLDNKYIEEDIFVNIPIFIRNDNQIVTNELNLINEVLNSIHNKLKIKITKVDDFEKYNLFFKLNNSIYKHSDFLLFEGSSTEFLYKQITTDLGIEKISSFLLKNKEIYFEIYKELIKLQEFITTNKLGFSDLKIKKYLKNLNIQEQINLINEINTLISYTINFDNQINIENFSRVIFQKHLIKPVGWNNLNFYQDIKIWKESNEKI